MLLDPKEIEVDGKKFIISKVPAVAGRRIFTQYLSSAAPKLGNYGLNESLMLELMSYVGIPMPTSAPLQLTTQDLIDNHVPGFETLLKLEVAIGEYNVNFLKRGTISNFWDDVSQALPTWISGILTRSLQSLSPKESPPTTNSEPSTP
jgi:hypothetical protein